VDLVDVLGDAAPVDLPLDQPSGLAPWPTSCGFACGRLNDGVCEFGLVVRCHPLAVRPSRVGVDDRPGATRICRDCWEAVGRGLEVDRAKRLIDRRCHEHLGAVQSRGEILGSPSGGEEDPIDPQRGRQRDLRPCHRLVKSQRDSLPSSFAVRSACTPGRGPTGCSAAALRSGAGRRVPSRFCMLRDVSDLPSRIDLRPGLVGHVYDRSIARPGELLSCWTYLSDGLRAHGQKELALTLCRPSEVLEGDFPRDVLELFGAIFDLASQGRIVETGDYTEFGPTGFLGIPNLGGLLYLPYQPIPQIPAPEPSLSAVLVPAEELEVVKAFGAARLMARLGQTYSHFPCPDWSDPRRAAVISVAEFGESVLVRMATLSLTTGWATQRGSEIILDLAAEARPVLSKDLPGLPRKQALALLTQLSPAADSLLVWRPGQQGPVAITPPGSGGSVVAGCFCGFVPGQKEDDVQLFEDGFVVMLRDRTWRRLRNALASGDDLELPSGPTGLSFTLHWR